MTDFSFSVTNPAGSFTGSNALTRSRSFAVDIRIFQSNDGGEIEFVNGTADMDDGLSSAAYLSMFGGNEEDSGLQGSDPEQWWGNIGEENASRRYRSETQHLLRSIPAVPVNLRRIEDAIERDLAWMTETQLARLVSARASIPALNRVAIEINIEIGDKRYELVFSSAWGARA